MMRSIAVATATFIGLLSTGCQTTAEDGDASRSPVVVELFTSEGCSSCPPADKLLKALSDDETLVLSFHVDYWNQLGWRDPFSRPEYTLRQRQYADVLGVAQVYTPQMIVGGQFQFVGSDKKAAAKALSSVKRNKPTGSLTMEVSKANETAVQFAFEAGDTQPGMILNLAIVEKATSSKVTAGENARANLSHVNVVRAFKVIPLESGVAGQAELDLPEQVDTRELFAVGYLQQSKTGQIGATARSSIP
ncbi:MAG: DUF1223 domain-containing protein [Planctomycetales bacterium]|nr:DUF1223 domain-containing protein [Planctomycetales bacterium]